MKASSSAQKLEQAGDACSTARFHLWRMGEFHLWRMGAHQLSHRSSTCAGVDWHVALTPPRPCDYPLIALVRTPERCFFQRRSRGDYGVGNGALLLPPQT